jgi:hypothetical protein
VGLNYVYLKALKVGIRFTLNRKPMPTIFLRYFS